MWTVGYTDFDGECIYYQVRSCEPGFGIDGGRISKLFVRSETTKTILAVYDRGWAVEPREEVAKAACAYLLKMFN